MVKKLNKDKKEMKKYFAFFLMLTIPSIAHAVIGNTVQIETVYQSPKGNLVEAHINEATVDTLRFNPLTPFPCDPSILGMQFFDIGADVVQTCTSAGWASGSSPWIIDAPNQFVYLSDPNFGIGVGTSLPLAGIVFDHRDGMLVKGTFNAGMPFMGNGPGAKMIWHSRTAAFRAGEVTADQWDDPFLAPHSVAFGKDNQVMPGAMAGGILSGQDNAIDGPMNSILGGSFNNVSGGFSSISGGQNNQIASDASFIGGGAMNSLSGSKNVIAGGEANSTAISTQHSVISGGITNIVQTNSSKSTISGGESNIVNQGSMYATIAGGHNNTAGGVGVFGSSVGGGSSNNAVSFFSTISGGQSNIAPIDFGTISGGASNRVEALYSTIGGGQANLITNAGPIHTHVTISGGNQNLASNEGSVVGGGVQNQAIGDTSTIGGGRGNVASGIQSSIGGGLSNTASGLNSTVGGGQSNTASGSGATVPGGQGNTAAATLSYSNGQNSTISSTALRSWAWIQTATPSAGATVIAPDAFVIFHNATGNVGIGVTNPIHKLHFNSGARVTVPGDICTSPAMGNVCLSTLSDEKTKKNIKPLEAGVLDKILKLQGVHFEWADVTGDDDRTKGVQTGLIAQKVEEVFPEFVYTNNQGTKFLHFKGFEGVTVEGFKELNAKLEEQSEYYQEDIRDLKNTIKQQQKEIDKLKKKINSL